MPKMGILHDYDLHANIETSSVGVTCVVCDEENISFQWSDYSGEAMCRNCGCCYQLKWGSDEQAKEGKYPYCNMSEQFIPVAREYWNERKTFVCYGMMLGPQPGMKDLNDWMKEKHPELLKEPEAK